MQLNLRDLFWLIFVAAVATMWWMDRSKLADRLSFYETPQQEPIPVMQPPLPQPYVQPPDTSAIDPFGTPAATDDPFGPAPPTPPIGPPKPS